MIKQNFNRPPNIKILINLGALLDIPTGFFVKGKHGENVLLGGLGTMTAIVGRGNRFKSTIANYMMLSATNRIFSTTETSISTYDTEINTHEDTLSRFIDRFEYLKDKNIINEGNWVVTDKTIYYGNVWFNELKKFIKSKKDNRSKLSINTPFLNREKEPMKTVVPTFSCIDSFTAFETEDVIKIQNENELGDAGGNTIHMRQGLSKMRFLMESPSLFGSINHYMMLVAHLGESINMNQSPYAPKPQKKLQYMKVGDKIKGVTDQFMFLMNNCWAVHETKTLLNQSTKTVEYPKNKDDNIIDDKDLNIAKITQLRGKSGPSGLNIDLVISQKEGVLPSLTEFYFIKNTDRYGLEGNNNNYHLSLLPEVNLNRTTVRSKIDTDVKLRRALNITAELLQMHQYHRGYKDILCTPKELYNDIKDLGYDWDVLLTKTRGWFTFNDDNHPLKFLSILDLLQIRSKTYEPYWIKELQCKKN